MYTTVENVKEENHDVFREELNLLMETKATQLLQNDKGSPRAGSPRAGSLGNWMIAAYADPSLQL